MSKLLLLLISICTLTGVVLLVTNGHLWAAEMTTGATAPPAAAATTGVKAPPAATATYVGSTLCKACHSKEFEALTASPHSPVMTQPELPASLTGCEACHGPGSLHVGHRKQYKPVIPKAADAAASNAVCGACHYQQESSAAPKEWQKMSYTNFTHSKHGRSNLSCLTCHPALHPIGKTNTPAKPAAELCLGCHAAVLEQAPGKKAAYTHEPVADGQCMLCHDPHGTPDGRMLRVDVNDTCRTCHDITEAPMAAAHQNYPLAKVNCIGCHDPHSHNKAGALVAGNQHQPFKLRKCELCHAKTDPGQPARLNKPEKDLCFSCHPATTLMPANEQSHAPAKLGMCLACHNPHTSTEKALLKNRPINLCFGCHKSVETDMLKPHKHKILESTQNCQMCHKSHSSAEDFLLVKDQMTLCGQCHKHSMSHPMVKKADGTPVINPLTKKPLVCSGCHEVHGSQFPMMTRGNKDRDLCIKCHNTDHN